MTTVRYFHNGTSGVGGMTGAPTLSGTAGSMIAVLDACLVDGWGSGTVDSVVISGGIATVTRAAGHPFDVDCVAEIAGATVTGGTINGMQKVLSVAGTTYTFATALANQTATGTITHKVASLGWAKSFSGTNLAAYRSSDVAGTREFLRVDDTGTFTARVVGYESMSGISAGLVNPFPSVTQLSGGGHWLKSPSADATARNWAVVGDSRGFYLWIAQGVSNLSAVLGFGDYQSLKAADQFACFLTVPTSNYSNTTTTGDLGFVDGSTPGALVQPRGVSGLGQSSLMGKTTTIPAGSQANVYSGQSGNHIAFPNPASNELYLSPIMLYEQAPVVCFRGNLPGVRFCPMNIGSSVFAARERLTGVTGMSGRAVRNFPCGGGGPFFIDVTGPWAR